MGFSIIFHGYSGHTWGCSVPGGDFVPKRVAVIRVLVDVPNVGVSLENGKSIGSFLHVFGIEAEEAIGVRGWRWDFVVILAKICKVRFFRRGRASGALRVEWSGNEFFCVIIFWYKGGGLFVGSEWVYSRRVVLEGVASKR